MISVNFDINKLEDVEINDIDMNDYPDFCDAFISYATYEGRELTDEELDWIQENYSNYVNEKIHNEQLFM